MELMQSVKSYQNRNLYRSISKVNIKHNAEMRINIILCAIFALSLTGCYNVPQKEKEEKIDTVMSQDEDIYKPTREDTIICMALAFAKQESGMKDDVVSADGRFVGCLQISECMVREANRILGFNCFFMADRYDHMGSYAIFKVVQVNRNPMLDIDKAIDIWNKKCGSTYRNNVRAYYSENLSRCGEISYF